MTGGTIGVVTGLTSEVTAVSSAAPALRVRCLGPGPDKAEQAARALLAEGALALVSAGICGALDPTLQPGDVIVPSRVLDRHQDDRVWTVDASWHAAVLERLRAPETEAVRDRLLTAPLLGSDTAVASLDGKRHLGQRTGAVAVDMESHAVARVAADAGVPFLVLRTVADTAHDMLPPWLSGVVNRDGSPNIAMVLRRLVAGPWRLPGLLRLAARSRAAEQALSATASALSPVGR